MARAGTAAPALELRLERERVQVRLAGEPLAPGVTLVEAVLDVPGGSAVDVSGGVTQFKSRLCDLDRAELAVGAAPLLAACRRLAAPGLASVRAALRPGFLELAGEAGGAPFTARVAPAPGDGGALRLAVHAPRLYGPSALPAPALATRLAAALAPLAAGRAEGPFVTVAPLRAALLAVLPRRGWKLPRAEGLRAALAELSPAGARVAFGRWDPPAEAPDDPELRALLHGAPAFAREERLLAEGDLAGAREAWRALPPGARAHPFAAARALGFLAADPRFHAEARALARAALERDPGFAPALAADAVLAAARGELARAAEVWSALAVAARARGEAFAALAAADACAACGEAADPGVLGAAVDAALALERGHVPALRAQRDLAARRGDRARLLRACRGLAAHAPDDAEKAAAHLRLAELLAVTDAAAAKLHRENARRLGALE